MERENFLTYAKKVINLPFPLYEISLLFWIVVTLSVSPVTVRLKRKIKMVIFYFSELLLVVLISYS